MAFFVRSLPQPSRPKRAGRNGVTLRITWPGGIPKAKNLLIVSAKERTGPRTLRICKSGANGKVCQTPHPAQLALCRDLGWRRHAPCPFARRDPALPLAPAWEFRRPSTAAPSCRENSAITISPPRSQRQIFFITGRIFTHVHHNGTIGHFRGFNGLLQRPNPLLFHNNMAGAHFNTQQNNAVFLYRLRRAANIDQSAVKILAHTHMANRTHV